MKTTQILRMSILAAVAIAVAGCAAKPDPKTFGGRLAIEGGEVAGIGAEWNAAQEQIVDGRDLTADGKARIKKGEKQIASGEDNVDDGKAMVTKGERMIAEGERKAADAEKRYRLRTGDPTASPES